MIEVVRDHRVARAVAEHPYPLVLATISGAHLYGFASRDSDVDIRGVHLLPVRELVGLHPGPETVERSEVLDALEIDLVTHDLRKFARLLLGRNGYVLEQLLSPLVVASTPAFAALRELAPGCITRHHAHHYLGFAATQWGLVEREERPRVKPLLYTYRVLLTGIRLMHTGEVVADLPTLLRDRPDLPDVGDLLERKRTGHESVLLEPLDVLRARDRYGALRAELEEARDRSRLPERPTVRDQLDRLIIETRLDPALLRPTTD